ncbi:hypothetical protein LSH36_494g02017 [Paralvinella palmiformis]|uniref:3-hydroxyisobutyryl-CoA hydrolase, mitochondrial n=1 Tax=Paralvinella palmiformis TaxID=53620 RepID=A0AAD9MY49_9ANNE|nr:hypothetical protein LSH36_494g02017 [Paralvinella palmiformis]
MASAAGEADEVLMERINDKGLITLNRPKALNSLNLSMVRKIYPQVKLWEEDPSISMVIIKGTGDKAFCAGGDVVAITEAGKTCDPFTQHFFKEEYILNNAIGTLQIPWIALIDGVTMGGGVGLSVHGHYRVATERTLFAMPETAIGLFPDVGGGYFLPRLGGKLGIYLALSGFRLKGRDVQRAGVATHFVESSQISLLEKDLLNLTSPKAKDIDDILQKYHQQSSRDADKEFVLKPHMNEINRLFSGHRLEDIFAALEREGSEWASKQLATLKKMSPTSMKVTLLQLQRGAELSLQDDLEMEYRLSQRFVEDKDFYEGVRAVLVEKDQKPKWNPPTIYEVDEEHVEHYFSPLPPERELHL